MTLPIDYGPVNPLETAPRYTTLDLVKDRLGFEAGDTSRDDQITSAIVAAEYAIDAFLGRSAPDGPGVPDVSEPGPLTDVPEAFREAALELSVAFYVQADAPAGSFGSDDFLGAISVQETTRQALERSPGLAGFRVANGFGVA